MVKQQIKAITEPIASKGFCERPSSPRKITASTPYGPVGSGLAPLADFWVDQVLGLAQI